MGRVNLPVTSIIRTGVGNAGTLVAGDETDNHYFVNDGRTIICVLKTGSTGALTFKTPGTVDGQAIAEQIVTPAVHATKVTLIGPFPPSIYNQSGSAAEDNGTVHVDLSEQDTFSLGAFRLPT